MTKSIFGWVCVFVLCALYSLFLSAYGFLRFLQGSLSAFLPLILVTLLALLIGISIALTRVLTRVCRRLGLDRSGYWRGALIVVLTIPFFALLFDSSPIKNDYELTDVIANVPLALESYDTLMMFRKNGGIVIDAVITPRIYSEIQTNPIAHSVLIYHAWDIMAEARSVIEKLDSYPIIADLTQEVELGIDTPILNLVTLRSIHWTYAAYARLMTAKGQTEKGVQHLETLHSVTRKALPHAAILTNKMIWIAIANSNIETAFSLVQDTHGTSNTLENLQQAFPPIPEEDVSLGRVMIGEYVFLKSYCDTYLKPGNFLDAISMTGTGVTNWLASMFRRTASSVVYQLTFRRNRTYRDLRKHFDLLIDGAGKRPPDMTDAYNFSDAYWLSPDILNLGGWHLISSVVPSIEKSARTAVKTKVLSDLLAIEIGDRLNQSVVLPDYYSDDEYKRDAQTGRFYSVGPDRKPNTDDDILLGKK